VNVLDEDPELTGTRRVERGVLLKGSAPAELRESAGGGVGRLTRRRSA